MAEAIPPLDWKFLRMFGDKIPVNQIDERDTVTAIAFSKEGDSVALGDKTGRIILFNLDCESAPEPDIFYGYEFQSHIQEFDPLKSVSIDEHISQIAWLRRQNDHQYILATNDRTIKLWKLFDKTTKTMIKPSGRDLSMPKVQSTAAGKANQLRKVFPRLHNYHINSICPSYNEEYLLSADDLKIHMWNLEDPDKAFIVIDLKPENVDELTEVITCATYHPERDDIFLYATSKGIINLADLRVSGVCDSTVTSFQNKEMTGKKNFFTEIVANVTDAVFAQNGDQIYSRDVLTLKVWDIRQTNKPLKSFPIFPPIKARLCDMYENESLFEKFNIVRSYDSKFLATGCFNNTFHVMDQEGSTNLQVELNWDEKTIVKPIPPKYAETLDSNYDFIRRSLKLAYHPKQDIIGIANLSQIYFYHAGTRDQKAH